jgi:hypothetical protein
MSRYHHVFVHPRHSQETLDVFYGDGSFSIPQSARKQDWGSRLLSASPCCRNFADSWIYRCDFWMSAAPLDAFSRPPRKQAGMRMEWSGPKTLPVELEIVIEPESISESLRK